MSVAIQELETCNFSDHETGRIDCKACETGYPRRCSCGTSGLIHAEIVKVQGNGYIQLSRCDKCGLPG